MSSAISLPTFYEKEKLTYQKLNAAMSAISAKFAAGVGAAELSWPLTAEGNLDMSAYNIVGGRQIWGYVNAAEYDTLDDAISAAGSGGVVLVPPETTVVANGASVTGTGVTVIGSGPSSVLQLTGGASSGYLLRFNSATRGMLANLTIDGNSGTGSSQNGINVVDTAGMTILNVHFRNFSGNGLEISGASSRVLIGGCTFDGSNRNVYVTQCQELAITACVFDNAVTTAIGIACASGTAYTAVAMGECIITSAGAEGVRFTGFNAVGSTSPGRLWMSDVTVLDAGGTLKDGIVAGVASAVLEEANISNCTVRTATAGGMQVNANHGNISGNQIDNPVTFGIDLDTSRYVNVSGNYLYSCSIGVDTSGAQNCMVSGNIMRDCTTPVEFGGTDNVIANNAGAPYGYPHGNMSLYYDGTTPQQSGSAGTITTFEIPANVLRQGSVVKIYVSGEADHSGSWEDVLLRYDGQTFAQCQRTTSASDDYYLLGEIVVSSYTGQTALGRGFGDQQSNQGGGKASVDLKVVTGFDCSTAIPIDIYSTGGTASVKMVTVWYGHSESVSSPWS